jgi:hypothetical protein
MSPNQMDSFIWGCRVGIVHSLLVRRRELESSATEGDSPVLENEYEWRRYLSTARHVEPRGNPGGPSSKAKY